ncbi:T9SS type A sorting domain-containing protein [Salibacteraceae bacterium]|nr:T9SS type A sorting domain-containing protein [Salibacteraceae bacterium]
MRLFLLIIWIALTSNLFGQDTIRFHKLGSQSKERGVEILQDSDTTYLLLVNSGNVEFESNSLVHILRIDDSDSILMSTSISTSGTEKALDLEAINDGRWAACGISNALTTKYSGFLYIEDEEGGLIEVYKNIQDEWSEFSNIVVVGDSILAVLEPVSNKGVAPEIRYFNTDGTQLNALVLSGFEGHKFEDFKRSMWGDGYLACGYNQDDSSNGFIVRFDSDFQIEWKYLLALSGEDVYTGIDETSDSSVIVIGYSDGFFESDIDILVQKFTSTGVPVDTIVQGYDINANNQDDFPYGLTIHNDTVYLTGVTSTYGFGGTEAFITVLSEDLGLLPFSSTFGTDRDDFSYSLVRNDRLIKGVGYTTKQTNGLDDVVVWTRKELTPGAIVVSQEISGYTINDTLVGIKDEHPLANMVGANWYSENGILYLSFDKDGFRKIEIFDLTGKLVDLKLPYQSEVIFSGLNPGLYILSVSQPHGSFTQKIWVD